MMAVNNAGLADVGLTANRRRAAGHRQGVLAQQALAVLGADARPAPHHERWVCALPRIVAESMTPLMTKHAYAALLRRALRGGGVIGP